MEKRNPVQSEAHEKCEMPKNLQIFILIQKLFFQYDARNRLSFVVFDAFMKKAYSNLMQNIEK